MGGSTEAMIDKRKKKQKEEIKNVCSKGKFSLKF